MKFDSKQLVLLALAFAFVLGITSARDEEPARPIGASVQASPAS